MLACGSWRRCGLLWGIGRTELGGNPPLDLSGKTYYQVPWTPPAGNAYYILAHAFIAAELNLLNGASFTPTVDSAMSWAESFFSARSPLKPLTRVERMQVVGYATALDNYNNGYTGPGHCSE